MGNTSLGKTQPQADVEQPLPAGCQTLHSTEALGVNSMVAEAHRPQARGLSFATWIALESGCNRTRTVPNPSEPPIGPSFGFCPFRTTARCDGSSHDLRPPADPLGQIWMIGWATAQILGLAYILCTEKQ